MVTINDVIEELKPIITKAKEELKPLITKAKRENLLFYHNSLCGKFWFTPEELEEELSNGKFIWGAINWQLRSREERIKELELQLRNNKREAELARKELEALYP